MKKTTSISIGGRLFYVEDDAYAKLDTYLKSVRARFSSLPESEEVMGDFETRAAEHLGGERADSSKKVVSMEDVDKLIEVMGEPEEFDGPKGEDVEEEESRTPNKRLFRNMDDAWIAGVCSGLAAYIGINPLWVRSFFIFITLAWGSGVLIYIILWAITQVAKTTTDKMQMRGSPITVDSLQKAVEAEVEEIKHSGKKTRPFLVKFINSMSEKIGKIVKVGWLIITKVVGFMLSTAASFWIVILVFILAQLVFNGTSPYIEFPLARVLGGPEYYLFLLTAFFVILVPLVFILFAGISLLRRKSLFRPLYAFSVLGVWLAVMIAAGVIAVRRAPVIEERVHSLPEYQRVDRPVEVSKFTKIYANNQVQFKILQGQEYRVQVSGIANDVEEIEAKVDNDTLVLTRHRNDRLCLFCKEGVATISVTVPTLEELTVKDNSWVFVEDQINIKNLVVYFESSVGNLDLKTDNLRLTATEGSNVELFGESQKVEIELDHGWMDALGFIVQEMTIKVQDDSSAIVSVQKKLDAKTQDESIVVYEGEPVVESTQTSNSRIYKYDSLKNKGYYNRYDDRFFRKGYPIPLFRHDLQIEPAFQ